MITGLHNKLAASVRLRFRSFGLLIAVLFSLTFAGVSMELATIARNADRIDDAWIANTRILGEMSDRLTELRLSEALLLLAPDPQAAQEAKALAAKHRQVLKDSEKALLRNRASQSLRDMRHTFGAVDAYLGAERNWEQSVDTPAAKAAFENRIRQLYEAADDAVDQLIEENAGAADADTTRISDISKRLFVVVVCIGALACVIKFWTMRKLDALLFLPLERITAALGQLSAGHDDVRFPAIRRRDEIGALANAFQHFRHNAEALREAYAATRLAEESAARLARHDPLTGLFNRRHMSERINELARIDESHHALRYFIYVIDLDRFKPINDLHGHAAGDAVLCTIADRLQALVHEDDVVARLGGDEFAVLAGIRDNPGDNPGDNPRGDSGGNPGSAQIDAAILADRIAQAICTPLKTGHCRIEVGCSIGVALFGRDGEDADSLIRSADAAMYRAKAQPAVRFQFFEESMREELRRKAELEVDVRQAVATHAIRPHFQPLVDLRSHRVYGFEILARWSHPQRGCVPPDTFVPVIERLGLATPFTLSMLRQACRDARKWPPCVSLALNVSPRQLVDPLLPAQILSVLREENFAPERLEIEMTESALVGDLDAAKATIESFRKWGVRISLDDFGTGYSSLHHLRELHFDKVKIDKSFVQSMLSDTESEKIVDAILNLSDGLGLSALAEGIETHDLERALRERGCMYGQGFLFGRAVPAEDVPELLAADGLAVFTPFGDTPHT
jgi:predicted signal transduction protein with EAL and GGDEF domain